MSAEPDVHVQPGVDLGRTTGSVAGPGGLRGPSGPVEGSSEGRVVTREGWPVAGAAVTLLGSDGSLSARAVTEDDGSFRLSRTAAGPATLLVAAPAHDPVARSVTVPAAALWDIGNIRLTRTGTGETPPAGIYVIDTAHSVVGARAHHLGLASVTGRFTDFAGVITVEPDVSRSHVDVRMVAASIDTGNAQRDTHLRSADFLDVERYPSLDFRSDHLLHDGPRWRLPGQLTLAGTVRPVELELSYLGSGPDPWGGTRAAFSATTELRRQDFRLNWNQAVGAGVAVFGTTLRVNIEIEAVLQQT